MNLALQQNSEPNPMCAHRELEKMDKIQEQYVNTSESYQDNEDLQNQMQRGRKLRDVSPVLEVFLPSRKMPTAKPTGEQLRT